jgi:hypothetical protein
MYVALRKRTSFRKQQQQQQMPNVVVPEIEKKRSLPLWSQ